VKSHTGSGSLRIVGGEFRGRRLKILPHGQLRPTSDRVRETLFNWLMHDINGARCLDTFAGSGALGFEALSRGAGSVLFIEKEHVVYSYLKQILTQFKEHNVELLNLDSNRFLLETEQQFDIIFLDPPFSSHLLEDSLNIIASQHVLKKHGIVYLESNRPLNPNKTQWRHMKSKRAGQVHFGLFEKI